MTMKEVGVKIAIGTITAMAAGIGSILGSEGAKAGIKALLNAKKDPVGDLPEPEINTDAIEADVETEVEIPAMEEGTEVEVNLDEDGA